jgi:predicted GH43/DUF377 family glycosyl hydrolase
MLPSPALRSTMNPTSRIAIYSGGADSVTALAYTLLNEVLDFVKSVSEL